MKPPPFDYVVATSLEHAFGLLEMDEDAKVIAGGQSLIPLMNLRFASPTLLVDITKVPKLRDVSSSGETLTIGALTRHAEIEKNPLIREQAPLLAAAAGWVAHPQIRNRGTLGGAIAHSDSAAEFPAVLLAMGATVVATSRGGTRRIPSRSFFGPYFETSLKHGELITAIEVPSSDGMSRWGFSEFARRKGDYAIGGAAVCGRVNDEGICVSLSAGLISAGAGPTMAEGLQDELVGRRVDPAGIERAAARVAQTLDPEANVHGSKEYRRAVVEESLRRALNEAFGSEVLATGRRSA